MSNYGCADNTQLSLKNAIGCVGFLEDTEARAECREIIAGAMYKVQQIFDSKGIYDAPAHIRELIGKWYDADKKESDRLKERYSFVREGNDVYWRDPDPNGTSGYYTVSEIRSENGLWSEDMVVLLNNGTSEVEATLDELHEG